MNDNNIYIINTGALFQALNANRKNNNLPEIEHTLIASKLGILFALKTNGYVNFKGEFVELNDDQLIALQDIFDEHFNADMTDELRTLVITQEQLQQSLVANFSHLTPSSPAPKKGIINKIKGFLRSKHKVQEKHA